MKRTIEIEDTLSDTEDSVRTDIRDNFLSFLEGNLSAADADDFVDDYYYQNAGCDAVHEICDSATPIYNSEIDGLYYLYGDEFEDSYKSAGIGDGSEDNHRQVAIYCYLSDKGFEELRRIGEVWKERDLREDESESVLAYMKRELAA